MLLPEVTILIAAGAEAIVVSATVVMLPATSDTMRKACAVVVVEESEHRYSVCELAVAEQRYSVVGKQQFGDVYVPPSAAHCAAAPAPNSTR